MSVDRELGTAMVTISVAPQTKPPIAPNVNLAVESLSKRFRDIPRLQGSELGDSDWISRGHTVRSLYMIRRFSFVVTHFIPSCVTEGKF